MKEYDNIIDEIENSHKYDAALMTTYNVDFSFFERYLLHLFLNNNIRHINIYADSRQLGAALNGESPLYFGSKYFVTPIDINSAFHPKVVLLLGNDKAKLIVSSANIKMSSYMANSEVYRSFYFDKNNTEYESLFYEAAEMFKKLNSISKMPDIKSQKLLEKYKFRKPDKTCQTRLLTSIDDSIINQISSLIHDEIRLIKVAVPFYDRSLTGLQSLLKAFNCENAELYIQDELNTFPVSFNKEHRIISDDSIFPFTKLSADNRERSGFYHGKVFELVGVNNTYVLYGSANCSVSALMRNSNENGNIECDVLETVNPDEQSFFSVFKEKESKELKNSLFNFITEEVRPYRFVCSIMNRDHLAVHIKSDEMHDDLTIEYEKQKLDYEILDDTYQLKIPKALLDEQSCIFNLDLKYADERIRLQCWYINQIKLESFRRNISEILPAEPAPNEDPEEYAAYYQALLDALFNEETKEIIEELNEETSVKLSAKSDDDETEEELSEDELNFRLDKDVSDRFIEKNTLFQAAYDAAKKYAPIYYSSLIKKEKHAGASHPVSDSSKEHQKQPRNATGKEKRIARSIKKYVKQHLLFIDTDKLSFDYYVHLCGIVSYIIFNMKYKEKVTNFMTADEITQIDFIFSKLLLSKYSSAQNELNLEYLTRQVLTTIIELGIQHTSDSDAKAKELLRQLNGITCIRNSYRDKLHELDTNRIIDQNSPFGAERYLGNLFGYKTPEELKEYFNKTYHCECKFNGHQSVFDILIDSKAPEFLADSIVMEVLKYLNEYDKSKKSVRLNYYSPDGKHVSYTVKFAGLHVNSVEKLFVNTNKKYKCRKHDKKWQPVYFK